ncbi:MAG TPA: polymer-forming cytoskeletal protein [Solirubrobacterales bacterium]|nr:polymer-forming cytoskeletal protein [Solirubrobacterales bacterium]
MLKRLPVLASLLALLALLTVPAVALATGVEGEHEEDAIVVVSGDVTVPRGETVDGVYVASGDVRIDGHVDGDVAVLSGDVLVRGRIDGDLFTASGTAHLLRGAVVGGDVKYGDKHPNLSLDARVGGDVEKEEWPDVGGLLPWIGGFLIWLAITVSLAILGVLLILVAPRAADALYARSRERVGPTIAIGIAIAIALPVGAALAAITILGLPLALGLGLALLPLWAVAYAVSAWALGRRLLGAPRDRMLAFLAGLAILRVAALVPFLGFLIALAAVVLGLGLIGAAIGAARDPQRPDPLRSPDS